MIIEAPREQNWNQKNAVEHMKHFKIHLLFNNNSKNTAAVTNTQKNTDSQNSKPKKVLHWSLSVNMPSPSPGVTNIVQSLSNLTCVTLMVIDQREQKYVASNTT